MIWTTWPLTHLKICDSKSYFGFSELSVLRRYYITERSNNSSRVERVTAAVSWSGHPVSWTEKATN